VLETPIKLRITPDDDSQVNDLRKMLKYKDKQVEVQIRNMKKNFYMRQRYGDEWVEERLKELNNELWKSVLFEDDKGFWTYSGIKERLMGTFYCNFSSLIVYPEYKLIPWSTIPKDEMRYYQKESVEEMVLNPHSHISLPTGSGKSIIILNLLKKVGLRMLVIAPSTSIVDQLYDDIVLAFGKKNVGMYAGSKKQFDKKITVATAQSLVRIDKESEAYQYISSIDAFCFDESHLVAADTFEYVCKVLLENAPYRWFTSATQERNDGKDLILEGIIGPRVYEKTIKELQDEGYLAKISSMIIDIDSPSPGYTNTNMIKMNQVHLYKNEEIARIIADLTQKSIDNNMPTLILIDEHMQEELLKKFMTVEYAYARSGADISKIVGDFNSGKIMCVIGTSAVSTGTNFLPVQLTIGWQANKSGIKVKQGVIGRSTRIHKETNKSSAKIVDFRIANVPALTRHANIRIQYYQEVGPVYYSKHTI
jgi:superfamily II DNA or RNA helicase